MPIIHTRRRFLTALASVGAAGLIPVPRVMAAEGALETTSVRFDKDPSACAAPQYVAEELLRAEGFTDIRYVETAPYSSSEMMGRDPLSLAIGRGEVDFGLNFPVLFLPEIEAGVAMTMLAGVHVGCLELFVQGGIRSIGDLKGKSVGLNNAPPHQLTLMAAEVGLDPAKDLHWVTDPALNPLELFAAGKIDAFLGYPPEPQELRARKAGHVIVNTAVDRPWSQYYCCMLLGNREYVRSHPVATKRVLRALFKAADLCATEPARVARQLVDRSFTDRYDYALQTLNEIPYDKWREYDPEDTVRFYALRLHEAGVIKSSPQKIIAENTDWRFLNELKRELKA